MKLSRPGPCGPAGTPRISRPFKQLSRSRGQVTHVILTRSPLNPPPKKGAGPFDLHVLSTPPAFVLSQDQTLQTKPNPNPNRPGPVQQKPEKKPRTQPDTPHNPPTPGKTTKTNTGNQKKTESTGRKKTTPENPPRTRQQHREHEQETGHNPTPTTGTGQHAHPNPPPPTRRKQDTQARAGAPPNPPPTRRRAGNRRANPRTPEPPTTRHPPQQSGAEQARNQETPEARENTTDKPEQPPKKRETPTPPPKPRTQNMTHYRDLKQHTHRDSTIRIRGPPPPGSARGASVSRTSETDSGPEPAVTGLLRLSSPRPPSGHWISPSPLGPERTLRTGGEAVKPRDGEPAHNAGPPSCPSCPGRFSAPAPRQGRRATARVRRPLRTSTTPPASSCSWAIGASSSSTLTLLR